MESVTQTDSEIMHQWFSLRVISGKERVVEENIMYESKYNNVENFIDEVFVPFEKLVQIKKFLFCFKIFSYFYL